MVDFGADLIGLHINGTARSVTGTQHPDPPVLRCGCIPPFHPVSR